LGALPAEAGKRKPVAAPAPDQPSADAPVGTPLATPAKLPLARTPVEPRRLALTRAALEHARGNDAAVVAILEPLGMERAAAFPDADRAAFLLGHAYLRLGQRERFLALARAAGSWSPPTAFTAWLAFEARLEGDTQGDAMRSGHLATDAMVAS